MAKKVTTTKKPNKYTKALGDEICRRIAEGESLVKIAEDPTMPHRQRVHEWIKDVPAFADSYARAKKDQADYFGRKVVDIVDQLPKNPSKEQVMKAREQKDAYKWYAGKLAPKTYGTQHVEAEVRVEAPIFSGIDLSTEDDG